MSTTRPLTPDDLYRLANTNMDPFTETYAPAFYLGYLARWPALCAAAENAGGRLAGYVIGKAEGRAREWHGHVSAVTVAPDFRRLGVARALMAHVERASDAPLRAFFVDLFVRASNVAALGMYTRLGYAVYRRVLGYYGPTARGRDDGEDAFDMRKGCARDGPDAPSCVPLPAPVMPEDVKF